ncbi:dephospho-CoA kinase [Haemophilus parahaemolyticus]|uniref:dephospho-CoA kinase n=1 Tax=Haemophilus parahaemolyticus TaxID=735 RepID=UPI0028EFFAA7|nr:dephospho-CoA kinase [Haemophilus parahaemolyticus]
MPYVVGLTGGIGSGKSTIGDLFLALGVPVIDADIIARQVVEKGSPLLAELGNHFGTDVLTEQGELNRAKLREIIFSHPDEKAWLNQLLHPSIRNEMLAQVERCLQPYVILMVPLLIENNLTHLCNRILVVDVLPETQIERATKRDNHKAEIIRNIIASQVSREKRLSYADDIIDNNKPLEQSLEKIKMQINELHQIYLKKAEEKQCQN